MNIALDKTNLLPYSILEVDLASLRQSWRNFKKRVASLVKTLSKDRMVGLIVFFFLIVSLPAIALAAQNQVYRNLRASTFPITPPITPTPTPSNAVNWVTDYVSLQADDFYILTPDGKKYLGRDSYTRMTSDPGGSTYTTLEVAWQEHGREMRFYLYFGADEQAWWVTEMRIYNGRERGDWIIFFANQKKFQTLLGTAFRNVHEFSFVTSTEYGNAEIYFKNFHLQAFLNQISLTPTPTLPPGVTVTPTPTLSSTPTPTLPPAEREGCFRSCSTDADCRTDLGLVCGYRWHEDPAKAGRRCRKPQCPAEEYCICVWEQPPEFTVTPTPTPKVSLGTCFKTCQANADCESDLVCGYRWDEDPEKSGRRCRKFACMAEEDCRCAWEK